MRESSYLGIAGDLRSRIEAGSLRPGDKLPNLRQLAASHGVSLATAQRAVAVLQRDRYVDANGRHGCVVVDDWLAAVARGGERRNGRRALRVGLVARWSWAAGQPVFAPPHLPALERSLTERLFGNGGELVHFTSHDDSRQGLLALREQVAASRVDAVLVLDKAPAWREEFAAALAELPCVCVAFGVTADLGPGIDLLLVEDTWGIRELILRLYRLGHRRIAYLGFDHRVRPDCGWNLPRLQAWQATRQSCELPADPSGAILLPDWPEAKSPAVAARLCDYSAVVCANDMMADAAISGLAAAGRRVPDDLSVTGFDNDPLTAPRLGLTTIAFPVERLASIFLAHVERRRAQDENLGDHALIMVRPLLLPRSSWGPARTG